MTEIPLRFSSFHLREGSAWPAGAADGARGAGRGGAAGGGGRGSRARALGRFYLGIGVILTEIYLCRAFSSHAGADGNGPDTQEAEAVPGDERTAQAVGAVQAEAEEARRRGEAALGAARRAAERQRERGEVRVGGEITGSIIIHELTEIYLRFDSFPVP
jgi:hypothetical protein